LAEPTILPSGRLKLDQPRQFGVLHSLVRLANIAASGRFTTADLYRPALDALGLTDSQYSLASFRYDLSKLRAVWSKGFRTRAAINWLARVTRSVWLF